MGADGNDTGGKDERLREHRIGHLRFQACGDCDWRGRIVFAIGFIPSAVRIRDACRRARKQLAQELGYTGALDGSAAMNVWLQKQVMTKLAESGGKVPDNLRA